MFFSGVNELAGVNVTYHSPDQVCQECLAEIHTNSSYWEICFERTQDNQRIYTGDNKLYRVRYGDLEIGPVVYKKSTRGRRLWINLNKLVLTEPEIDTEILVPTYGNKLRPMRDGDCIKRYTQSNPRVSKIYIKGNPDGERIKWGIPFLEVDPVWIGWKPIYQNLSRDVAVYQDVTTKIPAKYNAFNDTWSKPYNYTSKVYSHTITEYYNGKRVGVKVGGKDYKGYFNVEGNYLIKWNWYIGDRNFEEYGRCREYEKRKGGCKETKLI